jgi:hypothetical protein
MELTMSRFTYLILFSPGIIYGGITAYRLWKNLGKLDNPWRYRRRFLRIFLLTTLIAWVMDYFLIYFEAWTFPLKTHLWNMPVWPKATFYGNPMIIPVEEYLLFNTLITWFIGYLLMFQVTVSNNVDLKLVLIGADKKTTFNMEVDGKRITTYSQPFWLIRLIRWIKGSHKKEEK